MHLLMEIRFYDHLYGPSANTFWFLILFHRRSLSILWPTLLDKIITVLGSNCRLYTGWCERGCRNGPTGSTRRRRGQFQ